MSRTKVMIIVVALALIIGGGLGYLQQRSNNKPAPPKSYPEYLNFDGNYVFSPAKGYTIDEHSLAGVVFAYKGPITAATAADVINAGGVSLEAIKDLTDHSDKAFKDYVNNKLVPGIKKNLSTNNVKVKFFKQSGQEVADIKIDDGSKPYRYIKGGQHPVAMVVKDQNTEARAMEQSLTDIEKSDLNNQADSIKGAIKSTGQLMKAQKTHDLYTNASSDLRAKSTEAQLASALQSAGAYIDGNITISGVSYTTADFAARMKFVKLDKNDQTPAFGNISFKNVNGQWQLSSLTLPAPKP